MNRMLLPLLLAATAWGPPPVQLAARRDDHGPPPPPPPPPPSPTIHDQWAWTKAEAIQTGMISAPPRPVRIQHVETRQARRARERADQKRARRR